MKPAFRTPPEITAIARKLHDAGFQALLVGGSVRDQLLGRPAKDFDLATDASPEQVARIFPGTRATTRFGTALVPGGPNGAIVEITTFRTEAGYADFRRPDRVEFTGSIEEDLARRDFTVNAIAFDPLRDELIDPFGGQVDIAKRQLRAVGVARERFAEDALRLLRAVRFVAQLDFTIEQQTAHAIRASAGLLRHLALERSGQELARLLEAGSVDRGLDQIERLDLVAGVLPELGRSEFAHGRATLSRLAAKPDLALSLAALLHHANQEPERSARMAEERALAFGYGQETATQVRSAIVAATFDWHPGWSEAELAGRLRDHEQAQFKVSLTLRLACEKAAGRRTAVGLDRAAEALYQSGLPLRLTDMAIGGDELISAGVRPGPQLGQLLRQLQQAAIERRVANEPAALLAYARQLLAG